MSKSSPSVNISDISCNKEILSDEQMIITRLENEKKQDEFVINNLKAENRFLRDCLMKLQISTQGALDTDDRMFDTLNDAIENGYHLTHNGDTIYYPGEKKKRKQYYR